jgi:autotransporter-associated beta strand protein
VYTSTTPVKDGDIFKLGSTAGAANSGLTTAFNNYYVVGVGSTPSTSFSLTTFTPASGLQSSTAAAAGSVASTLVKTWSNSSNWSGGVPNAVDDTATFGTSLAPITNTTDVSLNQDATVGTLSFFGAGSLSLKSTLISNAGPLGTLILARSSGTPTVTVNGGGSFEFGDSNNSATGVATGSAQGNTQARLTIAGSQGLIIDNLNPIQPVTNGSASSNTAASSPGAFRFGYQLDWSKFSGSLTLKEGAFAIDGAASAINLSTLPINSDLILGTSTTAAQLELPANQGNTYVRGLDQAVSTAPSDIVNIANTGGPSVTFGAYSQPAETYTFNGKVGGDALYNGATALQLAGRLRFVKLGASTQVMNGRMEMTSGALLGIQGGTFSLGTNGAMGTSFDAHGQGTSTYASALPGTPASTNLDANNVWMHNGELKLDGTGLAFARTQTFGALIQGNGGDSGGVNGSTTFSNSSSGLSTFTLVAGSQPITLTFAGIRARNEYGNAGTNGNANGITYLFRGSNLGAAAPGTTGGDANIIFTNVFLGSGATLNGGANAPTLADTVSGLGITGTVGTTNYGVMKGALADTTATGGGMGFATYEQNGDGGSTTTKGVRLLNYVPGSLVSGNWVDGTGSEQDDNPTYPAASTTTNLRLNLTAPTAITGVTSNTLQLDNTSGASQIVTNTGIGLYATQGFLFSGNSATTLTGGTITGAASATTPNSEDVVILSTNSALTTIASAVSNPGGSNHAGWITYGGSGNFTITGNQTVANSGGLAFNSTGTTLLNAVCNGTGSTVAVIALNQGTLQLGPSFAVNAAVNVQVAAGTTLDLAGSSPTLGGLNASASYGAFVNGINNAAGNVINSGGTTSTLTLNGGAGASVFPGSIQGNINLQVGRVGGTAFTQTLNGANTYAGTTTVVNGSTLNIARYGQLPTTTVVTLGESGGTAGTLSLGDALSNSATTTDGAVNQEIAGLFNTGAGASAVIGNNLNTSILSVNTTTSPTDSFSGTIGASAAGVSNNIALRKIGTGTLTLSGTGNFYVGGTTIEGGTLSVGADNLLGNPGIINATITTPLSPVVNNVRINGGTLKANASFTLQTKRGLGIGPVSGSNGGTATIDTSSALGAATTLNYGGVIASAGNTGTNNNLTKIGLGTLALSGNETYNGITSVLSGAMNVTGSLLNNDSGHVIIALDVDGAFGVGNDISLTRKATGSYAGYGSMAATDLMSAADLKAGLNSTGSDTSLTMKWRARTAGEAAGGDPSLPNAQFGVSHLASDVMDLTNMANAGTANGITDPYALQMTYNGSIADPNGNLYLGYLNAGSWQLANSGNDTVGGSAVMGYNGSYAQFAAANGVTDANIGNFQGSYGLDTNGDTAWAIVDHNSDFAVVSVPEPASVGALVLASGLLLRRRRRSSGK